MWWRSSDIWIGGAIASFGAILLLIVIPRGVVEAPGLPPTAISPAFWPKTTAWMLLLFGALITLEAAGKSIFERAQIGPPGATSNLLPALAGFALLYGAWATILWIGLAGASALMTFGLGLMFGERRIWLLGLMAVLVPLGLYNFFTHVANVPIPPGILFE